MSHSNLHSTTTFFLNDPTRLVRRLCKHWAHKLITEYNETEGKVDFGDGKVAFFYPQEKSLTIKLTTPTESELETIQSVIDRHIERMIPEDEKIDIQWQSSL